MCICCIWLQACGHFGRKKIEKRKWHPSSSGDSMYPMSILSSTVTLEDGRSLYIAASGISDNGWGGMGPLHEQGGDLKAMPVRFSILWGSLLERKYYQGEWVLPKDTVLKYIDQGYLDWRTKKWDTYLELNFGVAPGGVVVVWLQGNNNQIEIGRYQAEETKIDIKPYYPGNENMTDDLFFEASISNPEAYQLFKQQGIPFGLWDKYREKALWKPEVVFDGYPLEHIGLEFFNGEKKTYSYHELDSVFFEQRPSLELLGLVFTVDGLKKQVLEFKFDREEMMSIFERLDPNQKAILRVETKDLQDGKVYFEQGDKRYYFQHIDWENQWDLDLS